jgi:hypothetical protein
MKIANFTASKQPAQLDAAVDPGILEIGASVSVNDEARRTIGAEIHELDAASAKLGHEIKAEDAAAAELLRGTTRAGKEVLGLHQGATEIITTMELHQQLLQTLKSSAVEESILVAPTNTTTNTPVKVGSHSVDSTNNNYDTAVTSSPSSVLSIQGTILEMKQAQSDIAKTVNAAKYQVNDFIIRKMDMVAALEEHNEIAKEEKLQVTAANSKHNTRVHEDDLEDEMKRFQTLQDNLKQGKARNFAYQKEVSDTVRAVARAAYFPFCFSQYTLFIVLHSNCLTLKFHLFTYRRQKSESRSSGTWPRRRNSKSS